MVLPQMIFVLFLLAFALVPGMALAPVDAYIGQFFPAGALDWEGSRSPASSATGARCPS
jgi:hypothetical protein